MRRRGARGGEGDLVGTGPEQAGDDLAGVVQQQPRVPARVVQPQRVREPLVEGGQQRLAGRRVQRLGGDRVEVDRASEGDGPVG